MELKFEFFVNLYQRFFFFFVDFDFPALLSAIATACLRGLPAFISVLMFLLMVFWDEPFFSGIALHWNKMGLFAI